MRRILFGLAYAFLFFHLACGVLGFCLGFRAPVDGRTPEGR